MKNKLKRQECVENLNWERVHDVMYYLNWTWAYKGIPSIQQLKAEAKRLLKVAHDGATEERVDYHAATGGLFARAGFNPNKGKVDYYQLFFALDEWSSND